MTDTSKAEIVTRKHMQRVSELLGDTAIEFIRRGQRHDLSKLEPIELGPLQKMQDLIDAEGQAPYGSDEYKRRTALLGPMLANHYAKNSHHPQYYEFEQGGQYMNGINGMDLFDVLEMVMDWKAASERGEESKINVSASIERFKISDQLAEIIRNTISRKGWLQT